MIDLARLLIERSEALFERPSAARHREYLEARERLKAAIQSSRSTDDRRITSSDSCDSSSAGGASASASERASADEPE